MRGDGVGVGDVGEVPGGARGSGHAAGGDDGGERGGSMTQGWSVDVAWMSVTVGTNRRGQGRRR